MATYQQLTTKWLALGIYLTVLSNMYSVASLTCCLVQCVRFLGSLLRLMEDSSVCSGTIQEVWPKYFHLVLMK